MFYGKFQGVNEIISNLENSEKGCKIPEDKKPLIFMPLNPLPKIEIPLVIIKNINFIFRCSKKCLKMLILIRLTELISLNFE